MHRLLTNHATVVGVPLSLILQAVTLIRVTSMTIMSLYGFGR